MRLLKTATLMYISNVKIKVWLLVVYDTASGIKHKFAPIRIDGEKGKRKKKSVIHVADRDFATRFTDL